MRDFFFLMVFVCLLAVSSAFSQRVIEDRSTVSIIGDDAIVRLTLDGETVGASRSAKLDLLGIDDRVKASASNDVNSASAKDHLEFKISLAKLTEEERSELPWYRLRYSVGDTHGIISLSQIIPDLFELKIFASNNLLSGTTYRVRIRAENLNTGEASQGVAVNAHVDLELMGAEDRTLRLTGTGITDSRGFATIDLPIPPDAALRGEGTIEVTGTKGSFVREATQNLNAVPVAFAAVSMTDKPIYQPGQTVNVRSILLKGGEGKVVVSGGEVEFRVTDEDDTLLYRERARTSEYGIVAIAWPIPANARLGDYRIQIRDANGEQIDSLSIKVSRYDLPNFFVTAKATKPFYLPGENDAEVEVRADYLFGRPVLNGKVRVVEETHREWNWKRQAYDVEEGAVREGKTDSQGKFTAKFDLSSAFDDLLDDSSEKFADIRYAAYFTDPATNRTEQRRFDIRISREPIHVYLIDDRDDRNGHLPVIAYVSAFYPDGTPAECEVEIQASSEEKNKFKTYARTRTNSLGAGKFSIPRPNIDDPDDDLDVRVVAKDQNGRRGSDEKNISFDDDEEVRVITNKTIYKPGEPVEVSILSTVKNGTVYLDAVSGWSVVGSAAATLTDGKAEVTIPYRNAFQGELAIAAYVEDPSDSDDLIYGARGIIFPAKQSIEVDASFDKAVYKPNEEATLDIGVANGSGDAIQSALGIVVLDRAVEERARTDSSFGGMFRNLAGCIGYGRAFGHLNVKDLNALDLSKPISADLQTAAEIMLRDAYYRPDIFRSRHYDMDAGSVYGVRVSSEFNRIRSALSYTFLNENYLHPVDSAGLQKILSPYGIDLSTMRDPWGTAFRTEFSIDGSRDYVKIVTAGPDKKFDTRDDFIAYSEGFEYFKGMSVSIDAAVAKYFARTGQPIRSAKSLYKELGVETLLDRWGHPYRVVTDGSGRIITLRLISSGPDGKPELYESEYGYAYGDDFVIDSASIDFFWKDEARITKIQSALKKAPLTEDAFRDTLKDGGVDLGKLRDGNGNPLYVSVEKRSRYWDKITLENVQVFGSKKQTERRIFTPVTQQIVEFTIRGYGRDGKRGTYDDATFMQVVHVLAEQTKDDPKPVQMIPTIYRGGLGSIAGTVVDPAGAAVPATTITATNTETKTEKSTTTSDSGTFLIANLPNGTYSVMADSPGFMRQVVESVPVSAGATASLKFTMRVGTVEATVSVAGEPLSVNGTDAQLSTVTVTSSAIAQLPLRAGTDLVKLAGLVPGTVRIVTRSGSREDQGDPDEPNSTPRLREYFPETLFWQPNVVTGPDGKAEVKFRMADNITTWKMYTIASTKNGKIGFAEKDVTAFQAFFADLDPPKFLTVGDEIHLPSQTRNYTDKKQAVKVTMAPANWFAFLGCGENSSACGPAGMIRNTNVGSGETANTIFDFKATQAIASGRQRVTAVGETDSDAIVRQVTVRPKGLERVETITRYSQGNEQFNIDFPAEALPDARSAELKIYPNLMSHVAESVEGLLERPYGCGEQTISSTYPNLMILKFAGGTNAKTRRIREDTERRARKYLLDGYQRLLGYQAANGGFTYWGGKDQPDLAVTAYAIRFLTDASEFIEVDPAVIKKAADWLALAQRSDGTWYRQYSWEPVENPARVKSTTTYVARALAMTVARRVAISTDTEGETDDVRKTLDGALRKALSYLGERNAEIDDPYSLSLLGLAAFDAGDRGLASDVAKRLAMLAKDEGGTAYWNLESNTAFNGWGSAGRVETTALVMQLFLKLDTERELGSKTMLFLLKNKDRYGVWYSTQTTINVLDGFIAAFAAVGEAANQNVEVLINGRPVKTLTIGPDTLAQLQVDLSDSLSGDRNELELRTSTDSPIMAQVVTRHYVPWESADTTGTTVNASRALKLEYKCDRHEAEIMQAVSCTVDAERIGYKGYGMLLAEIGIPPGAEVDRESLEKAAEGTASISRYEVLPDRIRVYMWSYPGGAHFGFKFRPRYGINAQTPASTVYDYYNPEAQATVAPQRFIVK